MTSMIAKQVGKRVFKEHAKNGYGGQDAYFEYAEVLDRNGRPTNKTEKVRRQLPPNLTEKEEKVLKKVIRRAHRLDTAINLGFMRIGWGVIFGLVPVIGDFFDTFMALMVYNTARKVDLPNGIQSKMMMNIIVDFCLGLVPFLGDIADGVYKANTRNAWLLYCHLEQVSRKRGANGATEKGSRSNSMRRNSFGRGGANVAAAKQLQNDRNGRDARTDQRVGDAPRREHSQRRSREYHSAAPQAPLTAPEPARIENGKASRGGFLSRFGGSRNTERDLERGEEMHR